MKLVLLTAAAAVLGLFALACGGDDSMSSSMNRGATTASPPAGAFVVKLSNWAVTPQDTSLLARTVQFWAVHEMDHAGGMNTAEGGATHELIVAAEDTPGSGKFTRVVLKLSDIMPGQSKSGSAALTPGRYELSCQVAEMINGQMVSHYSKGMHTTITVN